MKIRKRKAPYRLAGRIKDWEAMVQGKHSNIVSKHPNGFRKPGRNY